MANKQIQELTALTTPDRTNDKLPIHDASDTAELKYITPDNLLGSPLTSLNSVYSPASASSSAYIDLYEDTDNGTNKVRFIAPSSISSDRTITLPDATDTLVGKDTTDTLTNKTLTSPILNETLSGTGLTSTQLTTPKITTSINDANGNEVIKTPATASAVNEVTVTNAATGGKPTISATGDDTNISLNLVPKGTGSILNNGDAFINFATSGPQGAFSSSSSTAVDVTGATVTINPTKTVTVQASIIGRFSSSTAGDAIEVSLLIDGTIRHVFDLRSYNSNSGTAFALMAQVSVAAGARVIKMQARNLTAARSFQIDQANVNVIWG